MRKKRILVIGPWVSGHIQQWLGDGNSEYEIKVLTCHKVLKKEISYDVSCLYFINQYVSFLLFPFFLMFYLIKFKPNLIHVHYLSSYGLLSSFLPGKKILSVWGTDVNGKTTNSLILNKVMRLVLRRYHIVNSPGKHLTSKLVELGVDQEKILTLQYGIDVSLIQKKDFCVKSDKFILSSIRNWDDLYQIDSIIEAWKQLSLPNSELWLFGRSLNDANEAKIRRLSEGVDNIRIIGFVSRDTLYRELAKSNAFISVPTMDGVPLSVLEALYIGLEPILSDIPYNKDYVKVLPCCLLPKKFNENNLRDAIHSITSNVNKKYILENANYVKTFNDININRNVMFSMYNDLIGW